MWRALTFCHARCGLIVDGKYNADAGIVISASHNPMEFNGIKIFAGTGDKLPDEVENQIEATSTTIARALS